MFLQTVLLFTCALSCALVRGQAWQVKNPGECRKYVNSQDPPKPPSTSKAYTPARFVPEIPVGKLPRLSSLVAKKDFDKHPPKTKHPRRASDQGFKVTYCPQDKLRKDWKNFSQVLLDNSFGPPNSARKGWADNASVPATPNCGENMPVVYHNASGGFIASEFFLVIGFADLSSFHSDIHRCALAVFPQSDFYPPGTVSVEYGVDNFS